MKSKQCTKCREVKVLDDFYPDRRVKDGRYSHCKSCSQATSNRWKRRRYHNDKTWRAKALADRAALRVKYYEWIDGLKAAAGCSVCQEQDPSKLHFHHVDPSTKSFSISLGRSLKRATVEAELAKCIVLCATHHADHHNKERRAAADQQGAE